MYFRSSGFTFFPFSCPALLSELVPDVLGSSDASDDSGGGLAESGSVESESACTQPEMMGVLGLFQMACAKEGWHVLPRKGV